MGRHAFPHDTLHAAQTNTDLVRDELADGPHATVTEVIDVIGVIASLVGVQLHEVTDRCQDVGLAQRVTITTFDGTRRRCNVEARQRNLGVFLTELLRHFVTANLGLVVALRVEEEVLDQRPSRIRRRRFARAELAVDLDERFFGGRRMIFFESQANRLIRTALVVGEQIQEFIVALTKAERPQQDRDRLLALAVDADMHDVFFVDLKLEPRAATRDHLRIDDVFFRSSLVSIETEVDTWRTHQLTHDDAFSSVDDERSAIGHHWEIAHEDGLFFDLARRTVQEPRNHEQRTRERHVTFAALVF